MTGIKDIKELSRERICELADKAVVKFRNSIRPIYGSTDQGTPEHIGSCIALSLKGVPHLLTAAHVIDWNKQTTLYLGGSTLHELSMNFNITNKPNNDRDQDRYDFAIGCLPSEDVTALSDLHFIPESDISTNAEYHAGTVFTAFGYPNSKNKKVDAAKKSVSATSYHYSNTARTVSQLAEALGISGSDHILMGFNAKYSQDAAGTRVSSIKLNGLSGGAVFSLGNLADPDVLAGNKMPEPKLAALFIEFHTKHSAIVATKLGPILSSAP